MHDPEFEKHVQKKMEELQFNPSSEVWTKVEQDIKKEKRRRPVLWIFLLGGLLLGAGYWLLVTGNKNNTQTNIAKTETIPNASSETREEKKKPADDNINAEANKNSIPQQKNLKEDNQPKINADKANNVTTNNRSIAENNTAIKPKTSSLQKKSLDDKQSVPLFQRKNDKVKSKKEKLKREAEYAVVANNNISSENKNDIGIDATAKNKENIAADSQISKLSIADEIKTSKTGLSNKGKENKVADSQINKTAVAKNINRKKSKLFQLGFSGGIGFSDINKMATNLNSPPNIVLGGTGYNANVAPSAIQRGNSFYAGAFLEKSFSKKISISAGLNYHYYSTKIRTGKTVDSIIYIPAYNFSASSNPLPSSIPRAAYYTSGTSNIYFNHYLFFELPLLMNFQLNNNKKMPLTWQAGLSFSYLINTNALQFDPSSGTYYKDNSLYNKTQINLLTGFAIGFYRKKSLIEIGPEIQYGATNLLRGYTNNSQHIFYGGLKLSLVPWKNN
jgi:Outer membrane protein beta-barrel domain